MDTHALPVSALASALEVLAANGVEVMLTEGDEYTLKDRFEIAFACDTDHDRHGIVTRSAGLLPRNHYLLVAISYRFHSNTDR